MFVDGAGGVGINISTSLSYNISTCNIKSNFNCLCYHSLSHYKVRKSALNPP